MKALVQVDGRFYLRESVRVLPEHIAAGEPNDPTRCPVYLAMCEHFGTARISLRFDGPDPDDHKLRAVIERYDATGVMEPFEITRIVVGGHGGASGMHRTH